MKGLNAKKILKTSALTIIVAAIAFYSYYQSKDLLAGPQLLINQPISGSDMSSSTITVSGTTKNIAYLTLNGRQIFTDENGDFAMNALLLKGYNSLMVSAKDKFGREIKKTIQLVYKDVSR